MNEIFPTSFFTWARLLETILYYHQIKNILHKENILLFHYLPRYKTTDIDLIGHQSYHKGHFVSKVWHAYEIEKAHHNNQLVYPVYTWVKCTKFKLSVSIPSHINGFSCDKLLEPLSHQTLMRSKIANISRCTTGEHAIFN